MRIYQVGLDGYLSGIKDVPDTQRAIPYGWTRTAPPDIPGGQYAVWIGGGWVLTETPPPEPTEPQPEIDIEVRLTTAEDAILALMELSLLGGM